MFSLIFIVLFNPAVFTIGTQNKTNNLSQISPFDITLINGTIKNLSSYTDKPIVLNWGASWCPTCKGNLVSMNKVFSQASPYFNFLTVSYGGSKDTLNDIEGLKDIGPYDWDFGFDKDDAASTFQVSNGYLWILNTNLEIVNAWNYTIVPQSQLVEEMNKISPVDLSTSGSQSVLFLFDNPLFLLFGSFVVLGVVSVLILKFYPKGK
jgi:thiol-disulfide isomerase/thioredoxin